MAEGAVSGSLEDTEGYYTNARNKGLGRILYGSKGLGFRLSCLV